MTYTIKCLELIIEQMELNFQAGQLMFKQNKKQSYQTKLRKLRNLRKFNFNIADFCKDLIYTKTVKLTDKEKKEWNAVVLSEYKRIA